MQPNKMLIPNQDDHRSFDWNSLIRDFAVSNPTKFWFPIKVISRRLCNWMKFKKKYIFLVFVEVLFAILRLKIYVCGILSVFLLSVLFIPKRVKRFHILYKQLKIQIFFSLWFVQIWMKYEDQLNHRYENLSAIKFDLVESIQV